MEAVQRGIHRRLTVDITHHLRKRFLVRVHEQGPDDCWPWTGAIRNGYGAVKIKERVFSAHVVAWVMANNRQPASGMLVCHTCDNRLCCNPAHLYEGSCEDNARDMAARRKIHAPRGEEVHNAVLTDDLVRLVHAMHICLKWGQRKIARAICRSEDAVDGVLYAKTWKHVPIPSQQDAAAIVREWKQRTE